MIYNKKTYYCYFFTSILLSMLIIFRSLETFKILNFTIGQLALPVYLAGLDWEPLISSSEYYGYGLKWILFPIYKLLNNPYHIYMVSTLIYALFICIIGYFFYRMAISYWKMENTMFYALMFSIVFRVHDPIDAYTNELPLLATYMLLCIFIVLLIEKKEYKKRLSLIIAVWMIFMLTIHKRALVVSIAFFLIVAIYRLLYKEWIINFKITIPTYVFSFFLERQLTNYIQKFFWMEKISQGELANTSILAGGATWIFKSWENFWIFLKELVANLLTLQLHTYGSFAIVLALCVVMSILVIRKNKECRQLIDENKSLIIIVLFSVFSTLGIIFGLGLKWGRTISFGNIYGYKAYGYYRYFLCFIWPAFLGNVLVISKFGNKKIKNIIVIISIFINGVLICFWEYIAKIISLISKQQQSAHLERIGIFEFVEESTDTKLVVLSIEYCVILLFFLVKNIRKNRMSIIYPALVIAAITINLTSFGKYMSFPNFTEDDFYEVTQFVQENADEISKEIYVNGSELFIKRTQIMLPHYTIVPYINNRINEKNDLIISNKGIAELEETMWNVYKTKRGFSIYKRK